MAPRISKPAPTPTITKALVLHAPEDLRIETRPLPPPSPCELQIAVIATGICGSDLHYYCHGRNGDLVVQEPLTPGHESAGVVMALGSSIPDGLFSVGDHVALEVGVPCSQDTCAYCTPIDNEGAIPSSPSSAQQSQPRYNLCPTLRFRSSAKSFPHYQGTLQERVNHPFRWCHKLPASIPPSLGLLLEPLSVAIHAARRACFPYNSTVLVLGAGSIGLLCAYMAKRNGAKHVIISDIDAGRVDFAIKNHFADSGYLVPRTNSTGLSIESKLSMAKETASRITSTPVKIPNHHLRTTTTLPPTPPPEQAEDDLPPTQATAAQPVGEFDIVFECTGAESCVQTAIYSAKAGGRVMLVGMGTPVQTLPISAAALREVDLCGVFRYAGTYPEGIQTMVGDAIGAGIGGGREWPDLGKLITHRFKGLEGAREAFKMAGKTTDSEGGLVMKVVVEM